MYPLQVEIDQKDIDRLTRVYVTAQKSIEKELLTATDWGIANRKSILAQIDSILNQLATETDGVINDVIPKYYKVGAKDANSQLRNIKAPIDLTAGFNTIHQEAIASLIDDTATAFGESLTGVSRSVNTLLGKATRDMITQKMAEGMISGKALREVKTMIKGIIAEDGVSALKDKAGHSWSLDRYSEMLFRTKTVEARNRGLANRLAEYDLDLVQVSSHGATDVCGDWEGRILSLTGQTDGYPTLEEAEADGLFHPNCKHAINTLIPSLAKETNAYYPDEETQVVSKAEIEKATKLEIPNLPQ